MKRILTILLILAATWLIIRALFTNKPQDGMQNAKEDYKMEAPALVAEFIADEAASNEKYLNKILLVTGTVAETSKGRQGNPAVVLKSNDVSFGVKCELDPLSDHKRREFQNGERITLKGLCAGLLNDVVLVRCVEQ
jgi:hypothetical protein